MKVTAVMFMLDAGEAVAAEAPLGDASLQKSESS